MSEIPSAIVESPRSPLQPKPDRANMLRKLAAVAIVLGASFACCRMLKSPRSESSKRIEERQAQARERVGPAFDEVFEQLLESESTSIGLDAKLEVAPELGSGYDASNCGWGFDDAFAEALGPEVLTVSTLGIGREPKQRLTITAKIRPSGTSFQLPSSPKSYPGIAMTADLEFLGKTVHAEVEPGSEISFKRFQVGISFEGITANDVAGGVLQGTCKEAGYALLEAISTWKRPPPKPRADPVAECERGFHCRENAEALEATEPKKALKLYAKACESADDAACVRLGVLALDEPSGLDDRSVHARLTLEMACDKDLVGACVAYAQVRLLPLTPGRPIDDSQRREALTAYVRACDLGGAAACEAAAPLLAETPFADAVPILRGTATVKSKTLGTVFAVHWGQWTKFERGQPTVWVTTRPPKLPEGAIVTPFRRDTMPPGVALPAGADEAYAIALHGSNRAEDRCMRCNPSGGGDSIYSMRSLDCVCAVAPKQK